MGRLLVLLSVGLLTGCNREFDEFVGYAFGIFVGLLTLMSIVGLLALWRTIRALRQPDGYSIMGSITALFVLALPMRFIIPIIDDDPPWRRMAITIGLALYFLFILVCFILSVVRWTRTWRYKD